MDVSKNKKISYDITLIISFFLAVFVFLSIFSYSPNDPSFTHVVLTDMDQKTVNMFGRLGAYASDAMVTALGWTAYFLPLMLLFIVYKMLRIRSDKEEPSLFVVLGPVIFMISILLIAVISAYIDGTDLAFPNKPMGGVAGLALSNIMTGLLGKVGAPIFTIVLLLIFLMLLFAFSIGDVLKNFFKGVFAVLKAGGKIRDIKAPKLPKRQKRFQTATPTGEELIKEKFLSVEDEEEEKPDIFESIATIERDEEQEEPELKEEKEPVKKTKNVDELLNNEDEEIDIKPVLKVETIKTDYSIPINLLDEPAPESIAHSNSALKAKANMLEQKLLDFGVKGKVKEIQPGPVVTLFEYEPAPGIKINKISGLSDDLALAMSAVSIRIIAPIPGKGVVGIELPNEDRETVSMREILSTQEFKKSKSSLTVTLGKDIAGRPYVTDLAKMPHLLVAGTTGSGKSVSVNTMIASILYKSDPDKVKFVMIDPKMVELSVYDGIPHLAAPVVIDPRKAANLLRNVVEEMEDRYSLLAALKVRSIDSYNSRAASNPNLERMPYLVVIVDEFADLMIVAGKEVEQSIIRIAQMARAVGIHLILATQRPSVNVITGIIKANMPARLSFRVSSKVDSRTILDQNGAELLLGKGDGLFVPPGRSDTLRVHSAFMSDDEVGRLVEHLKTLGEPEYNMALMKEKEDDGEVVDESELDEKYYEALELVTKKGQASISMIQRYLRIGYNRAARIVEIMEKQGILAPSDGTSKPRKVLIKDEED